MCDNLSWEAQDIQGFIWRVEDDDGTGVVIVPAFGLMGTTHKKVKRKVPSHVIRRLSLVDLGIAYAEFGEFIKKTAEGMSK